MVDVCKLVNQRDQNKKEIPRNSVPFMIRNRSFHAVNVGRQYDEYDERVLDA